MVEDRRYARGVVRRVRLVLAAFERSAEVAAVDYRIGLIAVCDDETIPHSAHRTVDYEARVAHFRLVEGFCAYAVRRALEYAVAAILTPAHYKIVDSAAPYDYSSPGIWVISQIFHYICHFVPPQYRKRAHLTISQVHPDGRLYFPRLLGGAPPLPVSHRGNIRLFIMRRTDTP